MNLKLTITDLSWKFTANESCEFDFDNEHEYLLFSEVLIINDVEFRTTCFL